MRNNCPRCGRFMTNKGEWDEYPFGPYINTEWGCVCGYSCITCDDHRLKVHSSAKTKIRDAIKELERQDDEIYNDPEAIKRAEELSRKNRGEAEG